MAASTIMYCRRRSASLGPCLKLACLQHWKECENVYLTYRNLLCEKIFLSFVKTASLWYICQEPA